MSKLLHIPTGLIIVNVDKKIWEIFSDIVFNSNTEYYTNKMSSLFPGDSKERDTMRNILTALEKNNVIPFENTFRDNFYYVRNMLSIEEFEII